MQKRRAGFATMPPWLNLPLAGDADAQSCLNITTDQTKPRTGISPDKTPYRTTYDTQIPHWKGGFMLLSSEFCHAQQATQRRRAAETSLENVRKIATQAAAMWGIEALA